MLSRQQSEITALAIAFALCVYGSLPSFGASKSASVSAADLLKLISQNRFQEAKQVAQLLLSSKPQDVEVRVAYGKLLEAMGQNDEAYAQFHRAAQLDPKSVDALVALAQLALQNLDIQNALECARRALAIDKNCAEARIALVTALLQGDQFLSAEHELAPALLAQPNNAMALYLQYQIKLREGDSAQAIRYLESAVGKNEMQSSWKLELSELLQNAGQADAARRYLDNVLDVEPQNIDARLQLAQNQEYQRRDYDAAIAEYKRALTLDPACEQALAGVERCKSKQNNLALQIKQDLRALFGGKPKQ